MITLKTCECSEPQFAIMNPVCSLHCHLTLTMLEYPELQGKFICYYCGGEAKDKPGNADSVTGGTILDRLIELKVIEEK